MSWRIRWSVASLACFASGLAGAAPALAQEAPPSAASVSDALVTLGQDLVLEVTEHGPNQPWTVSLGNRGSQPLGVIADPGLLWFEVTVPGRAPETCVLPEPLRPKAMQRRSVLVLHPGDHYRRRFDPRFFCFAELGQILLVPGARVTPYFGWRPEPVAVAGRRRKASPASSAPAPLQPPFVAWRLPPEDSVPPAPSPRPSAEDAPLSLGDHAEKDEEAAAPLPAWRAPTEGLKAVQGATLELSAAYSAWAGTVVRNRNQDLELVMLAGSDAEDERNATVSFGVVNPSDRAQHIFVRRDLLEYEVRGPDGFFQCPSTELGPPDAASFTTLAPHTAERMMVRLIEICPRRSFARPGLYEVHARLNAKWSGQEHGLDAFVGPLEVTRPAFVRVRSGDRSSFARLVVPMGPKTPSGPGEAPPGAAEGEQPSDGAPEHAPEDLPADHEEASPPEEAPAPPEPPPAEVPPQVE